MKKLRLPHLFLFLAGLCGACGSHTETADPAETAQQDSLALKVALMPTLDCLPFYYADRCGIFKDLGLDVRLYTFNAQMDCDTAFARGHVDFSYTDLIRAALLQSQGTGLYVIMQTDSYHELLTARSKRVRNTKQLKEKMVAIARHSVTDLLLDTVVAQSGLDPSTVYHPQINDIVLRYDMLRNATLDAAFLPEPYATQARMDGDLGIYDSRRQHIRLMAFMVTSQATQDKRKKEQLQRLFRGYDKAVEQINRKENPDSIRRILLSYPVKAETADSLKLPQYKPYEKPNGDCVDMALHFLTYRNLISPQYTGDTLVNTQIIQ